MNFYKRTPLNYRGVKSTCKLLQHILPDMLQNIDKTYNKRPIEVLNAWPEIVGEKYAAMTKALSLENGVLKVKVNSSSLLNILQQYEKGNILQKLQAKFSKEIVSNIAFKI